MQIQNVKYGVRPVKSTHGHTSSMFFPDNFLYYSNVHFDFRKDTQKFFSQSLYILQ